MLRELIEFLRGSWHGLWCNDERCECRFTPPEEFLGGPVVGLGTAPAVGEPGPFCPDAPKILQRFPKYPLGAHLRWRGKTGVVTAIYASLNEAINAFAIGPDWLACQDEKPSSTDQVFYGLTLVADYNGKKVTPGAVLAGENDMELVTGG